MAGHGSSPVRVACRTALPGAAALNSSPPRAHSAMITEAVTVLQPLLAARAAGISTPSATASTRAVE